MRGFHMANPTVPTTANQLDHLHLKKEAASTPSLKKNRKDILEMEDDDIISAFRSHPELATPALVKNATEQALHGREASRRAAALVLTEFVNNTPQLANAALVKKLASITTNDTDPHVRMRGTAGLQAIVIMRPDLIDTNLIKVFTDARKAAGPNAPPDTAQQTLQWIEEARPDLKAQIAKSMTGDAPKEISGVGKTATVPRMDLHNP